MDQRDEEAGYGVRINNDCKFLVANNHIHNIKWSFRDYERERNAIWIDGGYGIIQNNSIQKTFKQSSGHNFNDVIANGGVFANAIFIQNTNNVSIRNNFLSGCCFEITAPFGVKSEGNIIKNGSVCAGLQFKGGITNVEMLQIDDPLFGDTVYQLQEGSPLINAGSENPLYNDRDGTRNDVGPSGGVWYDPQGWTTDKPVVISFDLSSESVLEGSDTEVTISDGRAVSSSSSE